ncbi:hypothetical protein BpHYR1_010502 [Brachionus plicatilis]|uniref:Uncharacterized protein n=1 Tax=Brachionus plicatilis TaxID=10195 RepID=A0A3M7SI84_BRAPC|nr:hypothetical protein BpHYR1_010502 [Brachionus plicatilis]
MADDNHNCLFKFYLLIIYLGFTSDSTSGIYLNLRNFTENLLQSNKNRDKKMEIGQSARSNNKKVKIYTVYIDT